MPEAVAAPPAPTPSTGSATPPSGGAPISVSAPSALANNVPRPGSAKEKLFQNLRSKTAGPQAAPAATTAPPAEPAAPATPPSPPPPPGGPPPDPAHTPDPAAPPQPGATPATPEGAPEDKKKVNPWKLLDEHKSARKQLEAEIVELKKLVPNEEARKSELERIKKAEERAKALEDEIRFKDYSQSEEFKTKYVEPYEKAWKRAMDELGEMTVATEEGGTRRVAPQDVLQIINAPMARAREMANAYFGDYADDVMAYRKEIRGLFDAQQQALEEAKKSGAEREQTQRREQTEKAEGVHKQVVQAWEKYNQAIKSDEKLGIYFNPVDGNDELNGSLEKGFQLVDKALSVNPFDMRLTEAQREEAVKMHAAVRNRAAAFGRLVRELNALKTEKAALEEKLKAYGNSTPPVGGSVPAPAGLPGAGASRMDSVRAALRKIAH